MNKDSRLLPALERPKLILQAFHLCKARTKLEDADTIWDSVADLAIPLGIPDLQKLPESIQPVRDKIMAVASTANSSTSTHRQHQIIPLLPNLPGNVLAFDIPASATSPGLTGGVYPMLIHDSYIVDLTQCFPQSKFIVAELGRQLNHHGCLLPKQIKASIGQTLILFGKPINWSDDEVKFQEVAKSCAEALVQDAATIDRPELYRSGHGRFLGGSIFEFESEHPDPTQRYHIIVWLDNHAQTAELEARGDYYYPMLQLLLSRSKIQWSAHQADLAYSEAGKLYEEFDKLSSLLEDRLKDNTAERLDNLENWLLEMLQKTLQYTSRIWDIQNQSTTIKINTENFDDRLNQMVALKIDDDLAFLAEFSNRQCQKHQKQITYDLEYLIMGRSLFDRGIDTIRGLVEIEGQRQQKVNDEAEKERDRSTTILVAMVGSGLAVSGISASVKPTAAKDALSHFGIIFEDSTVAGSIGLYATTIVFHAMAGIIFAFLIKWSTQRFFRYS
jgi:hypothetical protein